MDYKKIQSKLKTLECCFSGKIKLKKSIQMEFCEGGSITNLMIKFIRNNL
jgi:hypothetical protein